MPRRPDRWWMRWYLIGVHPGGTLIDPEEWVECATLTRWGAQRLARSYPHLYPMRRKEWLNR